MSTKIKFGLLLVLLALTTGGIEIKHKISSEQILNLVNRDRTARGLSPLTLNPTLSLAALAKAEDMLSKNYFSHIAPDGTKPWFWMKTLGYNYVYAGENLAAGYTDPHELESSWMASPSHRANILSPLYSDTGVAVLQYNDSVLIVQFFGNKAGQFSLNH